MIVVIIGPTGVGKTKLSLSLAKKYEAEIINADAMQIYKEMNIEKNVIVLTGYNSLEMIRQISLYSINYFMLKPFDYSDLEFQILNTRKNKVSLLNKRSCIRLN